MIRSTALKRSLLICYGLIFIIMGHGFVPVGLLQIFSVFSALYHVSSILQGALFDKILFFGSLAGITGSLLIVASFYVSETRERKFLIWGVILLWLALGIWKCATIGKPNTFLHLQLTLPFAYCTLRMMFGEAMQRAVSAIWKRV